MSSTRKARLSLVVAWGLVILPPGASAFAAQEGEEKKPAQKDLSHDARRELLARAQVWTPTDVAAMDLRNGPADSKGFKPNELVTCDRVGHDRSGKTPKFHCALNGDEEDVVKVKYGRENAEVYGEVLSSRLVWALGFGADLVYPVRVHCNGCPSDPWNDAPSDRSEWTFDPATIEREFPGKKIDTKYDGGWSWQELDLTDEAQGGAPKAHRDALKLLAVLIQHTDNKPQQQRLVCPKGAKSDEGTCAKPLMVLNDLGKTFGEASWMNSSNPSGVNLEKWSETPVWKDAGQCIGNMKKSATGTLENPRISEAGRAFLAGLLTQLSDQQLQNLFDVARVELRSRKPGSSDSPAPVSEWVDAFKQKREEIVGAHCPA